MDQSGQVPEQFVNLDNGLFNLHNALFPLRYQVLVVLDFNLELKLLLPAVSTEAIGPHIDKRTVHPHAL